MSDTFPKEVREAMISAVIENIGPVVGNPEYLARPGNVERLEARRRNAAASHVDAALSALEAAGWVCVPKAPTEAMISAGACVWDNYPGYRIGYKHSFTGDFSPALGGPRPSDFYAAMLAASRKEKDDA